MRMTHAHDIHTCARYARDMRTCARPQVIGNGEELLELCAPPVPPSAPSSRQQGGCAPAASSTQARLLSHRRVSHRHSHTLLSSIQFNTLTPACAVPLAVSPPPRLAAAAVAAFSYTRVPLPPADRAAAAHSALCGAELRRERVPAGQYKGFCITRTRTCTLQPTLGAREPGEGEGLLRVPGWCRYCSQALPLHARGVTCGSQLCAH